MVKPPGNGRYSIRLPEIWSVRTPDESRMSIGVCWTTARNNWFPY